jgi:hypothetical protein
MTYRKPLVLNGTQVQNIQAGDSLDPSTFSTLQQQSLTNGEASVALTCGQPVYLSAASTVKRAQANAALTQRVVGIVSDPTIAAAANGLVALAGPITLTTAQWDAVTGQTGGLTPGPYYLDPASPGKLSTVGTSGQYFVPIGNAINTTTLAINLQPSILL